MTKINCDTKITSSAADASWLQLVNLTSASPTTAWAQAIGVDAAGNVVNVAAAGGASHVPATQVATDSVTSTATWTDAQTFSHNINLSATAGNATIINTWVDAGVYTPDVCTQIWALAAPTVIACTDSIVLNDWINCSKATLEDVFNFFHNWPVDPNNCLV